MSQIDIAPVWGRLVVLPDDINETDLLYKSAKSAGLDLSHITSQDKEQFSQIEGRLIAIGGNCFESWSGEIPKVGDKVIFDKYAGCTIKRKEIKYRMISDTDVLAICSHSEVV